MEPTPLPLFPEPEIEPLALDGQSGESFIAESRHDRMIRLAKELLLLGVADRQVTNLLMQDLEIVERQLRYLPYRKARKPASMIFTAIVEDFEKPAALWEEEHR